MMLVMGPGTAVAAVLGVALGPWLPGVARRWCRSSPSFGMRARILSTVALVALLVMVASRFGFDPAALGFVALAVGGVLLSIVDLVEHRLPDALVVPTAAAVAVLLIVSALLQGHRAPALTTVVGGIALVGVYTVLVLITPRGMGMGDVKLAAACGAALGSLGLRPWLLGLAAGFLINGLAAVVALGLRRTTLRSSIPFGPSMVAGVFVALALS